MAFRKSLTKFFIVACNLNQKLVAVDYLTKLSNNEKENYFRKFSEISRVSVPVHYYALCTNKGIAAVMRD